MRKIIMMMSVSLDGFFEGPNRELDWHMVDDELHTHFNEQLGTMSAFLDGRVAYELMAGYWPTADADPASPAPVVEFARMWRETPKIVYSRTLETTSTRKTQLARTFDPEAIRRLKASGEQDILIGGPELAAHAFRAGLIDECHLFVIPIIVGGGKSALPDNLRLQLELLEERRFGNGVVYLRYGTRQGSAT